MTTTGGPEHSVAEPVTEQQFDGDDIVVVPDAAPPHHRRWRALAIGAVVVLLAAGIGIAIAATRDDGHKSAVRTVTPPRQVPARTPASQPKAPKPKTVHPRPPASGAPGAVVASPPVNAAPPPPPPPVAPTQPPATSPPAEPASVLQWTATPASLSIPAGGHATLTVHVVNPTDGTVTLGNPLSCAPVLRGPKGQAIGFGVCEEMAQVMSPHDALTQRYTITAPSTPGNYTATVEHLFTVKVKVTAP